MLNDSRRRFFYLQRFWRLAALFFSVAALSSCTRTLPAPQVPAVTVTTDVSAKMEAPVSATALPEMDSTLFGRPPPILATEAIFELTEQQQQRFLDFFRSPRQRDRLPADRIGEYLQNHNSFEYDTSTRTAKGTLAAAKGDCLSLAILTSALAKLVDLDIRYQLVTTVPSYGKVSDIIFVVEHVRCKLKNPAMIEHGRAVMETVTTFDYFNYRRQWKGDPVSEDEFVAMYYRNIAAEVMARKSLFYAYWLLRKALELDPDNAHTINMLAIVFRRKGDSETAEQLYQYGLSTADRKLHLLKNYRALLKHQQRFDEAEQISAQLENLHDPNPYNWILLAQDAIEEQSYRQAIKYYQKAIDLAPYLDDAHLGQANAHLLAGERYIARQILLELLENAYTEEQRELYRSKLKNL